MPLSPPILAGIATALMVPGDRPDRFDKALERCGHAMIIDLEDAVAAEDKPTAREHVAAYLDSRRREAEKSAGRPLTAVRMNALSEAAALDDLYLLRGLIDALDFIVLAKTEGARDIEILRPALARPNVPVMAVIETVSGLTAATDTARALTGQGALAFGGADYSAETGMAMTERALLMARTRLVEAAAPSGLPVFDVPYLGIGDDAGLRAECAAVRELGFSGKLAIHPSQTGPIIEAFAPGPDALAEAERIIAAFEAAEGKAIQVDGRMVDKPVYQRALAIRARGASPTR